MVRARAKARRGGAARGRLAFVGALVAASALGCGDRRTDTVHHGGGGTSAQGGAGADGGAGASGGEPSEGGAGGAGGSEPAATSLSVGGERPVQIHFPPQHDGTTQLPLLILLHELHSGGLYEESYFDLTPLAAERGYYYAYPNGTGDDLGVTFWNATDACCNFFDSQVDDVAYLTAVIEEATQVLPVDPDRVYLIGHGNGGFMTYRMACDRADLVAAAVSVGGATFYNGGDCEPSQPVPVLEVHGTDDAAVLYEGGTVLGTPYPSAEETVALWAGYNGCSGDLTDVRAVDYDAAVVGAETMIKRYDGCAGSGVELWMMVGASKKPSIGSAFRAALFDFFDAH